MSALPDGRSRAITEPAEDIAAHVREISATEPFIVPTSIFDEVAGVCTRLGII
jgi:hypothetical protein